MTARGRGRSCRRLDTSCSRGRAGHPNRSPAVLAPNGLAGLEVVGVVILPAVRALEKDGHWSHVPPEGAVTSARNPRCRVLVSRPIWTVGRRGSGPVLLLSEIHPAVPVALIMARGQSPSSSHPGRLWLAASLA